MRLTQTMLSASALVLFSALPALADTPLPLEPADTWECPQPDGGWIFTNKERAGCRSILLKPLSVVPSLENVPTIPQPVTGAAPHYDVSPYSDRVVGTASHTIPDWAGDWYASNTSSGSVKAEVCGLYLEYLQLAQKTRGGLWFGTDSSYGGNLSGSNQRWPSYSFYDNARWMALSRIFGTGFVPIGCP